LEIISKLKASGNKTLKIIKSLNLSWTKVSG